MIKVSVLHNELDKFVEEKSGFSVFIKVFGKKILFDTSIDKDILENSKKLGIDLFDLDYLVLSHGHWDHTEGLKYLKGIKADIIAHPDCFEKKYYNKVSIGSPFSKEEMERYFKLILSKEPYSIDENIIFLGQIPRKTAFESKKPIGYLENGEDDFVMDDSAIVIKTDKGLIILSGCSHSGICNIIKYAKEVCEEDKILVLLGGFHLFDKKVTDKTVDFIKDQNIKHIYPAHCLDEYAFSEFEKIGAKRIRTLQKLVI